jgi:hypothetical protein
MTSLGGIVYDHRVEERISMSQCLSFFFFGSLCLYRDPVGNESHIACTYVVLFCVNGPPDLDTSDRFQS